MVPDSATSVTYVGRTYRFGHARDRADLLVRVGPGVLGIDMTDAVGSRPPVVRPHCARLAHRCPARGMPGHRRGAALLLRGRGRLSFTVVWAQGGTVTVDAERLEVCRLDGSCAGDHDLTLDAQPVLLREA